MRITRMIMLVVFLAIVLFMLKVYAYSGETQLVSQSSFLSAQLLSKNDVISIATHHINNYMKDDIQTQGKVLKASRNFINLYDIDMNLFAYLVPLLEGEKEIGYISVGAIEDGYDSYSICIDDNVLANIRAKIQEKLNIYPNNAKVSAKLVFIPPMNFVVNTNDSVKNRFFDISSKKEDIDVTSKIFSNHDGIIKDYYSIRKPENKAQTLKILTSVNQNELSSDNTMQVARVAAAYPTEDYRLKNDAQGYFVPVTNGTTKYYGGDQSWWSGINNSRVSNGCGPVAAANITNYLARKNASLYGKLYVHKTISKADFLTHMNTMYTTIDPGVLGAYSLTDFGTKVKNYASSKGVTLSVVPYNKGWNYDMAAAYIKNGIFSDCPVGTLNLKPSYQYGWHWMTITKYFRDYQDSRWVAVSTWGSRYSITYRPLVDAMNSYPNGGCVYFQ